MRETSARSSGLRRVRASLICGLCLMRPACVRPGPPKAGGLALTPGRGGAQRSRLDPVRDDSAAKRTETTGEEENLHAKSRHHRVGPNCASNSSRSISVISVRLRKCSIAATTLTCSLRATALDSRQLSDWIRGVCYCVFNEMRRHQKHGCEGICALFDSSGSPWPARNRELSTAAPIIENMAELMRDCKPHRRGAPEYLHDLFITMVGLWWGPTMLHPRIPVSSRSRRSS